MRVPGTFSNDMKMLLTSLKSIMKSLIIIDQVRSRTYPVLSLCIVWFYYSVTNTSLVPFTGLTKKERTEILNFYSIYLIGNYSDKMVVENLNNINDAVIMLNKLLDKYSPMLLFVRLPLKHFYSYPMRRFTITGLLIYCTGGLAVMLLPSGTPTAIA